MARPTKPINLTPEQKDLLESISHSRETPHSLVVRTRIILQTAQGINNKTISLNLDLCEDTVTLWRQRWINGCAELEQLGSKPKQLRAAIAKLLADKYRPGSPATFSAEQVCQIWAKACESPPEHLSHWTQQDLVRQAVEREIVGSISTSTIGRFFAGGRPQTSSCQILA